jgi:hypothetical protein
LEIKKKCVSYNVEFFYTAERTEDAEEIVGLKNYVYVPEIDPSFVQEVETLISTALLMGMDHAKNKIELADGDIPPLPFEDAKKFMKSRIPVTKAEWNSLEPKLRFRAFTVARLTQLDYIDTARQVLTNAIETGKGTATSYSEWQTVPLPVPNRNTGHL